MQAPLRLLPCRGKFRILTLVTPLGRLTRMVLGPLARVTPKVPWITLGAPSGCITRVPYPATGVNTVIKLRHRRDLTRTWLAFIRFATVIKGV